MFYYFDELASTIDEAREACYGHGDVVVARHQTAGRGQRGKKWSGTAGESLMFSVVLDTSFLRAGDQFAVLQAVALALVDTMDSFGLEARIKWPNDIYIGDRKVVGVLIDHTLGPGGMLARSGAGIGINVGQREFDEWIPNPTSMALETGRKFETQEVLEKFYDLLMPRFESLRRDGREVLADDYNRLLYRRDAGSLFALPDGTRLTGVIRGVGPGGELNVETPAGMHRFLFHEVSMVVCGDGEIPIMNPAR
jgi:BirA family biotin operon repressor/biotin-[acetyl-CoA-carboxylase] ligase